MRRSLLLNRGVTVLLVVVVLAAAITPAGAAPPPWAGKPGGPRTYFSDLKKAPWAWPALSELTLMGVFRGFPDGTIRPNDHLTRAQAVAMLVRALGLQDEAEAMEGETLPFPDARAIRMTAGWAVGYIAYALGQGWIPEQQFNRPFTPNRKATRLWATELVSRTASYFDPEADTGQLDHIFTDVRGLSPKHRAMLFWAFRQGFIRGFPDGSMRPNEPLTRAQFATIMQKYLDDLDLDFGETFSVRGTVDSVRTGSRPAITVRPRGRSSKVTYPVDGDAEIFRDGDEAELSDLRRGDRIRLWVDRGSGRAVYIRASSAGEELVDLEGIVVGLQNSPQRLTLLTAEDELTFTLADNAVIRRPAGSPTSFGHLKVGFTVKVDLDTDDRISEVRVTGMELQDIIHDLELDDDPPVLTVTVGDDAVVNLELTVNDPVTVKVGDQAADLEDLRMADEVHLTLSTAGRIRTLTVTDRAGATLTGRVTGITPATAGDPAVLEVEAGSADHAFDVADGVQVTRDGDEILFEDLRVGDRVRLTVDGLTGAVTGIRVLDKAVETWTGTINLMGANRLRLVPTPEGAGTSESLVVYRTEDTQVVLRDGEAEWGDLEAGMTVTVAGMTLNARVYALEIVDEEDED